MVTPEPENRAKLHLRQARKYADWMLSDDPILPDGMARLDLIGLATMHYLGYLAELKWSEDPYNDGRHP